jgi:hypothetical protein
LVRSTHPLSCCRNRTVSFTAWPLSSSPRRAASPAFRCSIVSTLVSTLLSAFQHPVNHRRVSNIVVSALPPCQHYRKGKTVSWHRKNKYTNKQNNSGASKTKQHTKKKEGHFAATIPRPSMNSAVRTATVETKRLSACPGLLVGSLPKLRAGALLGRDSGSKTSQLKQ